MGAERPPLRVVAPDATPEEVAAIVAALSCALAGSGSPVDAPEAPSPWVSVPRLAVRRMALRRGDWRLSERIGRRAGP